MGVLWPTLERDIMRGADEARDKPFYGCAAERIDGSRPQRKAGMKNFLPATSYSPDAFPSYCGGALYVLNRYTASLSCRAMLH